VTTAGDATLSSGTRSRLPLPALAAAAVTIPHALGLGLIAYAPLGSGLQLGALALWSAAIPGALATLLANRPGVVYAPTTVVALLFAAIFTTIASSAREFGMSPQQMLAACGFTVALGFAFQWLLGALRLASFARFLPISVTHGFAAGIGLSMIFGQVRHGFGMGDWQWSGLLLWQAAAALAVVALAHLATRRWPRGPGLLAAVALVSAVLWLAGLAQGMPAAAPEASFALPPLPDYTGVPWLNLIQRHGMQLLSLALLMALVNSLDVLVFNQELDLEHGLRAEPNRALRRESLVGVLCGLCGLIPASISSSRSRIILSQAGPSPKAGPAHAAILLVVAVTGHWWLHWVPIACLSGALLLAGYAQIPAPLWSRGYARAAPVSWSQSWLVALVFVVAGGAGALVAGLVVATFVLLHASASTALRRCHLDGQVRSRRLRPAAAEAWLAPRMNRVAVIELQGVMSFGVAAHMTEQVRALLDRRHDRVIIDTHRVGAWDATALVQLKALGRELAQQGRQLVVSSLADRARAEVPLGLPLFADLDRALEWAEAAILDERPVSERPAEHEQDWLGELGDGMSTAARADLEKLMERIDVGQDACLFGAGDSGREIYLVQSGLITMATAWPPATGMRLASIGRGMPFGEMAFLSGARRSAFAGADGAGVQVVRLTGEAFDQWAVLHPGDALVFMRKLALVGTTRLAVTTRQLRAILE
jgi:SulP family sulfate permease